MKPRQILLIVLLMFACTAPASSQRNKNASDKHIPKWMNKLPKAGNESFIYIVGRSTGTDMEAVKASTIDNMTLRIPKSMRLTSNQEVKRNISDLRGQGNRLLDFENHTQIRSTLIVEGEPIDVFCRPIDEYWEVRSIAGKQTFEVNVIYQVAVKRAGVKFDEVESTSQYKLGGLWRSVIIPGWGQMYKGSTGKGISILGMSAVIVGGIIYTENQRATYRSKMGETYNATLIKSYSSKAKNMETARNICIGGLAAVYVWNIVDALAAKGARHIVPIKNKKRNFAILPTAGYDYCGLYMGLTF